MVQIVNLQNKVNSLSDAKFQDFAPLRFWIAAEIQNCNGIMGNVFERPPVQEGLPSTIFTI